MAKTSPPFRAHLKRGRGRARSQTLAFQDLQRVLEREYRSDPALLARVIDHEDEMLPWMLVRQEPDLGDPSRAYEEEDKEWLQRTRVALCLRAARDLESEGICWSPLVDALSEAQAWDDVSQERQSEGVPSTTDLLYGMEDWVGEQESPAAFRDWLSFRSYRVPEVVARHATCIDVDVADRISRTGGALGALACNEHLSPDVMAFLVKKGWSEYKRSRDRRAQDDLPYEMDLRLEWLGLMAPLAARVQAVSADMRAEMLEEVEQEVSDHWRSARRPHHRAGLIAVLANTTSLTAAEFAVLVRQYEGSYDALTSLLQHALITPEQQLKVLGRAEYIPQSAWSKVLSNPLLPIETLERASEDCRYNSEMLANIVSHPNATTKLWVRIAELPRAKYAMERLASMPEARSHPDVRRALAQCSHESVLLRMIGDANAAEWPGFFQHLAQQFPRAAVQVLDETQPPAGTVMSPALIAPLLTCQEQEVRLSAIRHAGRFSEAAVEPAVRVR